MNPALQSILCCDAVVPGWDGKFICYGVFSELQAPAFPFTCPHFALLTTWVNGSGFFTLRIKLYNPQKSILIAQSPEIYFTLEDEEQVAQVQVDVNQVVFTGPGSYQIQVMLNERVDAEYPLRVVPAKAGQPLETGKA